MRACDETMEIVFFGSGRRRDEMMSLAPAAAEDGMGITAAGTIAAG